MRTGLLSRGHGPERAIDWHLQPVFTRDRALPTQSLRFRRTVAPCTISPLLARAAYVGAPTERFRGEGTPGQPLGPGKVHQRCTVRRVEVRLCKWAGLGRDLGAEQPGLGQPDGRKDRALSGDPQAGSDVTEGPGAVPDVVFVFGEVVGGCAGHDEEGCQHADADEVQGQGEQPHPVHPGGQPTALPIHVVHIRVQIVAVDDIVAHYQGRCRAQHHASCFLVTICSDLSSCFRKQL
mmetsp:Transcript_18051/g.36925  ORF Transcript_18051/g.36925 Transcript_18051/m.36925 type:complete len:236 (-) Transcript_18051:642-1349(-)